MRRREWVRLVFWCDKGDERRWDSLRVQSPSFRRKGLGPPEDTVNRHPTEGGSRI